MDEINNIEEASTITEKVSEEQSVQQVVDPVSKTATAMEPNLAGALSYILGAISGAYFWMTEKENKFVRFHAMQSMLCTAAAIIVSVVLGAIPVIGWTIIPIVNIGFLVIWFVLMYKAYNNEKWELPIIGDIAKKQVEK
ncbi:DUF4870 domain-containing protein [Patescibacteria group bacterium]|nr:DUF4870 domain-containing protein [Patescibacteria group bacterium]